MERASRRGLLAITGGLFAGCLRLAGDDRTETRRGASRTQTTPTRTRTEGEDHTADTQTRTTKTTADETTLEFRDAWGPVPARTITIHDGMLLRNGKNEIVAHDPATGSQIWTYAPDQSYSFVTDFAVSESTVYVGALGEDGPFRLFAVDTTDGSLRWRTEVPEMRSRGLVAGGMVLYNQYEDGTAQIIAVDGETGDLAWTMDSGPITVNGSTALGTVGPNGDAYLVGGITWNSAHVYRMRPTDGSIVWDWTEKTPAGPPVYADGALYLGMYDKFASIDAANGSTRWTTGTFEQNVTMPVVDGETVYFGSNDTGIYALSTADGTKRWRYQTDGAVEASPVHTSGLVIAGSDDNNTYAVHTDSGDLAAKTAFPAEVGELDFGAGTVFVVTGYHEDAGKNLFAFSLEGS